ncbi:hypothetical protein ABPG73_002055 [Tetrahymena malaccensis]
MKQEIEEDSKKKNQSSSSTIINGYEIFEILGKGSFGQVFKAKKNGKIYALKLLDLHMIKQRNIERFVSNEINLMKKMNHKNIVKIYETFQTTSVIFLVLEYCNQGTLLSYISKKKPKVEECVDLFIQILAGVKHIHEKGVLHRDLKPENMFLHDGVLKIADFGLAQFEQDDFVYCGTSFYMAPEVLERRQVTYKSDLWSLGIVLFYMIFRRLPFYSKSNLLKIIKEHTDPFFNIRRYFKGNDAYLNMIDLELDDFFQKVLVFDINKRIQFKELFNLSLIEKQMKEEDQKVSFIFYSNLDNNLVEKGINVSLQEDIDQPPSDQRKLLQDQSNQIAQKQISDQKPVNSNGSNNKLETRSSQLNANFQIQISYSSIYEDIPEDDSPNIQSIYPINNLTHFDKKKQEDLVKQVSKNLDPNKIYIQPNNFSQSRQSISFLEHLNPKRFSYEDVLTPNILSDFEVIQPASPITLAVTKAELDPSNQDIFQLCSQIKSSILHLFSFDFQKDFSFEINQLKVIVYKYSLLGEILNKLAEFRLGYSTQCLLNFILSKVIVFIINSAIQYFDKISQDFQKLDNSKKIQSMLLNDLKSWENKLLVYRNGIDLENDIKQQALRDMISDESKQYANLKDLIQPFCIILELLFSISFQLSEQNTDSEKNRFRRYCIYLLLVINIQYIFDSPVQEKMLLEEYFESNSELHPIKFLKYIDSIDSSASIDNILSKLIKFCPMQISNIKMIDFFTNKKYF